MGGGVLCESALSPKWSRSQWELALFLPPRITKHGLTRGQNYYRHQMIRIKTHLFGAQKDSDHEIFSVLNMPCFSSSQFLLFVPKSPSSLICATKSEVSSLVRFTMHPPHGSQSDLYKIQSDHARPLSETLQRHPIVFKLQSKVLTKSARPCIIWPCPPPHPSHLLPPSSSFL